MIVWNVADRYSAASTNVSDAFRALQHLSADAGDAGSDSGSGKGKGKGKGKGV